MAQDSTYHDTDTLLITFLQDGEVLIDSVTHELDLLEKEGQGEERINQIFRDIHSFKSEASYLEYQELAEKANAMEEILHQLRESELAFSASLVSDLFHRLNEIAGLFEGLKANQGDPRAEDDRMNVGEEDDSKTDYRWIDTQNTESGIEQKREDSLHFHSREAVKEESRDAGFFTPFEIGLLKESRVRGENFFRLVCEIHPETQMKYPRVYLLMNNLELIVNVVKTVPRITEEELKKTNTVFVYFTASIDEAEVFRAVSIDEIERVQLSQLNLNVFLKPEGAVKGLDLAGKGENPSLVESGFVSVETNKIEDLIQFMDEAQFRITRVSQKKNTVREGRDSEGRDSKGRDSRGAISGDEDLIRVGELINRMEEVLKDLRMVRFGSIGMKLMRFIRDLSEKKRKNLRFQIQGEELLVDRRVLSILSDPLIHLLRNAVDHGIEFPKERVEKGKPEEGTLLLSAWKESGRFFCSVKDDGRGVDPKEIKQKPRGGQYREIRNNEDLLRLLASPGFSTREEADSFSGRGVGLDLVMRKVRQNLDGDITMKTSPGSGTEFLISVPEGYTMIPLLVVSASNLSLALPKSNCDETLTIESSLYNRNVSGLLTYNGIPVYSCYGKMAMKGGLPKERYGCVVSHLGKKGLLLVDEILFERDITQKSLKMDREVQPHMFEISAGAAISKLLYLSPSFLL